MRTAILATALTMSLFGHASLGATKKLHCENHMFRDASLDITEDIIAIQDSFFLEGGGDLQNLLKRNLGLPRMGYTNAVKLILPKKDLNCTGDGLAVMNCQGSTKEATIEFLTRIEMQKGDGHFLHLKLHNVEVHDLNLVTSLSSRSSVDLGDNSTTVRLDQLNVKMKSTIRLNGEEATPHWSTFFYTPSDKNQNSFCVKN